MTVPMETGAAGEAGEAVGAGLLEGLPGVESVAAEAWVVAVSGAGVLRSSALTMRRPAA